METQCASCKRWVRVSDEQAGKQVTCPACRAQIAVPASTSPKLRKACPGCGAPADSRAVVCVKCGLDMRTGKKLVTQTGAEEAGPPLSGPEHIDTGRSIGGRFLQTAMVYLVTGGSVLVGLTMMGYYASEALLLAFSVLGIALCAVNSGTFSRIALQRSPGGKWIVKKTKFLSFVVASQETFDLAAYDSLLTSYREKYDEESKSGALLYGVLGYALMAHAGNKLTLELGSQHGARTRALLYRGPDDGTISRLIEMIQRAAHLPCRPG